MNEIKSTVIACQWTQSHTGRLIPLVKVRRVVRNDNINVRLCTVGGLTNLQKLDLYVGDSITIKRGQPFNLVIGVEKELRPNYASKIAIPTHCHSCNKSLTVKDDNELYCTNESCVGVNMAKLKRFCHHDGLDLDCLSDYRMRVISERRYLSRPSDLLKTDRLAGWLTSIPSTDNQHVEMLKLLIDMAKEKPLANILYALGVGELKLYQYKMLDEKFNITQLINMSIADYLKLGLTQKQAEKLTHYFMCEDWLHDLENMKDFRVFEVLSR